MLCFCYAKTLSFFFASDPLVLLSFCIMLLIIKLKDKKIFKTLKELLKALFVSHKHYSFKSLFYLKVLCLYLILNVNVIEK